MHINFSGDLDLSNFPTAEVARRLYETNFRQAYTAEASSMFNYIGEEIIKYARLAKNEFYISLVEDSYEYVKFDEDFISDLKSVLNTSKFTFGLEKLENEIILKITL